MRRLEGNRAIVTGAGFGRSIALRLAEEGVRIETAIAVVCC